MQSSKTLTPRKAKRVAALQGRELFNAWLRARMLRAYNAVTGANLTDYAQIPRKPKRMRR